MAQGPPAAPPEVLSAPLVLEYPFRRTVGPVQSAFLTGLRDGVLRGVKTSDGGVLCPPTEYDPETSEELTEVVDLAPTGVVTTWSWEPSPRPDQPLDRPFAWALIRLDGASTAMLHAVDAGTPDRMETGMRVRVRWAEERVGAVTDIACFEPEPERNDAGRGSTSGVARAAQQSGEPEPEPRDTTTDAVEPTLAEGDAEPVTLIQTPARLDYRFTAGEATTRFLRGIAEKKILGERCPKCQKVYVPPRGSCPIDGVPTAEQIELPHSGIVTTFCVVNLQFYGQGLEIPYVCATVLLDGADIGLFGLVQEIPFDEVRMGMRVEAVWEPDIDLKADMTSIKWWRPTGEPDADYESYREHV